MEVPEHLRVEQVRLVDEEDGVDPVLPEILDVRRDRVEDRGGGRLRREAEGEAELPVEVAAPERRVVAVREPVPGLGRRARTARRTQVFPTPGSPVRSTEACSEAASQSSSTIPAFEVGSQRSASAISFEKGAALRPNAPR
jgi:hypothetical protein